MRLVPATEVDIPFITALEGATETGRATRSWRCGVHRSEMLRRDVRHCILADRPGSSDGFEWRVSTKP